MSLTNFVSQYIGEGPFSVPLLKLLPEAYLPSHQYKEIFDALEQPFKSAGYPYSDAFRWHLLGDYDPTNCLFVLGQLPLLVGLDETRRFEHTWIVAPTGTGKTNLLEQLIAHDLPKVLAGEASMFIMDSQNELIPRVASQVPPEKLVYLEPDERFPLALNIFDNEAMDYSSSLELADFVMAGLLGAELTAKQAGVFRYLIEAMTVIPDATIHTFKDFLKQGWLRAVIGPYLERLDPTLASFSRSGSTRRASIPPRRRFSGGLIPSSPTALSGRCSLTRAIA